MPLPQRRDATQEDSPVGCGPVRKSGRARWRALVLSAVWVLFAAHFLHWRLAGRTLTPVEPSEAMQTLEQGLVNAGFLFFAVALASTLVLGRWFCGWGCHLVALQDLCTWLLRKLGLRPKPFRSRLLVYVPLLAALYMFVWPTAVRVWYRQPRPALTWHLTTADYWATFPGPAMAVLTFLVCGFLIVYLLGNKGFCTYACPYGGFFGVADRLAPGKIRVTEACDGCGHCTATCTSNVRVHEEVKHFGMVVDPGCMKCTDCVSVCPKHALYFGFGAPSVAPRKRAGAPARPRRPYDYSWGQEIALAGFFALALVAFRGLYDAVPFLLALGLAAISAFLLLQASRLLRVPSLQLRGVLLRRQGTLTRAGFAFLCFSLLFALFLGHSLAVQYHTRSADRLLDRAARVQAAGATDAVRLETRRALAHLTWLERFSLFPSARTEARLGAACLVLDDLPGAREHLQRALELAPTYGAARHRFAELLAREGDLPAAVAELKRAVRDNPALADARQDLIAAARRLGTLPEVASLLAQAAARRSNDEALRREAAALDAELAHPRPE